jgi:hypothetical protein
VKVPGFATRSDGTAEAGAGQFFGARLDILEFVSAECLGSPLPGTSSVPACCACKHSPHRQNSQAYIIPPHHLQLHCASHLFPRTPSRSLYHTIPIISTSTIMSPATSSPTTASSEPTSPAVPVSPPSTSPARVDDTALKATDAGVKKPPQRKQSKRQIAQKAKANMQKLHTFSK